MWTGPNGHYQNRLSEIGGMDSVKRACSAAGAGKTTSTGASSDAKAATSSQRAKAKKASKPGCVSILENVPDHWCAKNWPGEQLPGDRV